MPDVPVQRGRYWSMAPVVMLSSQVGLLLQFHGLLLYDLAAALMVDAVWLIGGNPCLSPANDDFVIY